MRVPPIFKMAGGNCFKGYTSQTLARDYARRIGICPPVYPQLMHTELLVCLSSFVRRTDGRT